MNSEVQTMCSIPVGPLFLPEEEEVVLLNGSTRTMCNGNSWVSLSCQKYFMYRPYQGEQH